MQKMAGGRVGRESREGENGGRERGERDPGGNEFKNYLLHEGCVIQIVVQLFTSYH